MFFLFQFLFIMLASSFTFILLLPCLTLSPLSFSFSSFLSCLPLTFLLVLSSPFFPPSCSPYHPCISLFTFHLLLFPFGFCHAYVFFSSPSISFSPPTIPLTVSPPFDSSHSLFYLILVLSLCLLSSTPLFLVIMPNSFSPSLSSHNSSLPHLALPIFSLPPPPFPISPYPPVCLSLPFTSSHSSV